MAPLDKKLLGSKHVFLGQNEMMKPKSSLPMLDLSYCADDDFLCTYCT